MLAAAHLDNFLFLLFIAVAIFFQLLTRAAGKGRRGGGDSNRRSTLEPPTPRPARELPEETDEDRVRKFLEALGQPTSSKPPAPVQPRPTYQRPSVFPRPMTSPLPPLTTRPPDLPRQIRLPGQIPATREARAFRPTVVDAPFEVRQGAAPPEPASIIKTPAEAYAIATRQVPSTTADPAQKAFDVVTMLRSSSGLRNAIILREIFGPPRSMQPVDLIGNV
ncbi:MAG TPA: hypothetical protein VKS98_07840 [Chthoniobacterales bacterium]|nr:hypothetical protein [Chthoniobacterales bacterium]